MTSMFLPPTIVDVSDKTPVVLRKGNAREKRMIDSVILHQMAVSRGSVAANYMKTNAHFAVLPDGTIMQLHPADAMLWASNGFNDVGIAIEFAGNFPTDKGVYHKPDDYGRHIPPKAQIDAGCALVRYLRDQWDLDFVFAHRQGYVSDTRLYGRNPFKSELQQGSVPSKQTNQRSNCPGPHIWYGVGEWAIQNLGMSDGGAGYKLADGDPIPDSWRKPPTT